MTKLDIFQQRFREKKEEKYRNGTETVMFRKELIVARRRRHRNDPAEGVSGLLILGAFWLWFRVGNTTFYMIIGSIFILSIGIIILLIHNRKKKLLTSGINVIDSMTGQMFEELILEHFRELGYKGHMTPATADYGADLVLESEQEIIVAQIK